ncbi:hypothetical protein KPZU09_76620 [Klebsiella pneumoniae]|uniref:Membrane protein n=1 Tax=Klebsiella pneumoniae TaxID=573 RepID=A0A4P0YDJ0_KLEPN|nr:hypothetical protein KPZU09_76620 [Klebsiella pneumoniae]VTM58463.1 membrane protein [Klebsiella pneumoniae]
MANHVNRNNFDENAEDIHNDVSQLADTLEEVLKSWGSDAKEEAEAARVKAQSLLKETRARLNGHNRVQQAALDARRQRAMRWAVPIPTCAINRGTVWAPPPPSGYLLAYCSIYVDNSLSVGCRRAIGAR